MHASSTALHLSRLSVACFRPLLCLTLCFLHRDNNNMKATPCIYLKYHDQSLIENQILLSSRITMTRSEVSKRQSSEMYRKVHKQKRFHLANATVSTFLCVCIYYRANKSSLTAVAKMGQQMSTNRTVIFVAMDTTFRSIQATKAIYSSCTAVYTLSNILAIVFNQVVLGLDQQLANRSLKFQVHECVHLLRELIRKMLEHSSAEPTNHGSYSLFMIYPSLLEIK
jgi:hypothetical protein